MYKIFYSRKFKKSLKSFSKSGSFDSKTLIHVIDQLRSGLVLPEKYKDHNLKGNLSQFRECHVKSDVLLIYHIDGQSNILTLVDMGSHSKLFNL